MSRQVVWLPPGDWYHFFNGTYYRGGGWHAVYGTLADMPLFAPAGAIVPLGPKVGWGGVANPAILDVHVFAGADREFRLYEDDGETQAHAHGSYGITTFRQQWRNDEMVVTVETDPERRTHVPEKRSFHFRVHGVGMPEHVALQLGGGEAENWAISYDDELETLSVTAVGVPTSAKLVLTLRTGGASLLSQRDRTLEQLRGMVNGFKLDTLTKMFLAERLEALCTDPALLAEFELALSTSQVRALLEVSQQAGMHHVSNTRWPHLLIFWNNLESEAIQYRFTQMDDMVWRRGVRYHSEHGVMPGFRAITPEKRWRGTAVYPGHIPVTCDSPT